MKNIFIIALVILFVSCEPKDDPNCQIAVKIINNSNKVIYFGGRNSSGSIGYNPLKSGDYFKVAPGGTIEDIFARKKGCYEDLFTEGDGKLYYLFYDEQILVNNWEDIVENDMVLKRFSFTLKEMQDANWTISYDEN